MQIIVFVWITLLCFFSSEYLALNGFHEYGILQWLQVKGVISQSFNLSPDPGRSLSLLLGWIGFLTMVAMNAYSIRKRMGFLQNKGRLVAWLNFHIFCGLVGPTFILFHCNFKVRGLVAISFWSMVISLTSGIIGRYFYTQLVKKKVEFESDADKWWQKFLSIAEKASPGSSQNSEVMGKIQIHTLQHAGLAGLEDKAGLFSAFSVFVSAFIGDVRMIFQYPTTLPGLPPSSRYALFEYAVSKRRALTLEPFQSLMGYWHTFHFPFAVFMYVAAVIHIVTALLFGVSK